MRAALVTIRNVRLHRQLGIVGAAFGAVVLGMGIFISIAAPIARLNLGQMPPALTGLVALYNLTDMIAFGGFFVLAMPYRASPALHRRLILCSSVALTGAAAQRKAHPIFLIGTLVFAVMFFKVWLFSVIPGSQTLGQWIVSPFM